MSAAEVTFETLDYEPAKKGQEERFSFRCPKHDRQCAGLLIRAGQNIDAHPSWEWDGVRKAPTFKPSIDCQGCWHGYIRNGRCVTTQGAEEP